MAAPGRTPAARSHRVTGAAGSTRRERDQAKAGGRCQRFYVRGMRLRTPVVRRPDQARWKRLYLCPGCVADARAGGYEMLALA